MYEIAWMAWMNVLLDPGLHGCSQCCARGFNTTTQSSHHSFTGYPQLWSFTPMNMTLAKLMIHLMHKKLLNASNSKIEWKDVVLLLQCRMLESTDDALGPSFQ